MFLLMSFQWWCSFGRMFINMHLNRIYFRSMVDDSFMDENGEEINNCVIWTSSWWFQKSKANVVYEKMVYVINQTIMLHLIMKWKKSTINWQRNIFFLLILKVSFIIAVYLKERRDSSIECICHQIYQMWLHNSHRYELYK